MLIPKDKRTEFHDGYETGKKVDLRIWVPPVDDAGEGEELCALIDLGPESVFESFLSVFQGGGFLDQVEVGEEAENFGEAVGLEDIKELEGFLGGLVSMCYRQDAYMPRREE